MSQLNGLTTTLDLHGDLDKYLGTASSIIGKQPMELVDKSRKEFRPTAARERRERYDILQFYTIVKCRILSVLYTCKGYLVIPLNLATFASDDFNNSQFAIQMGEANGPIKNRNSPAYCADQLTYKRLYLQLLY